MKYLIIGFAMLVMSCSFAQSTAQLPDVTVDQAAIGGDILMIQMKAYLIISGKESQSLEAELGMEGKKRFTRDIVLSKKASELETLYTAHKDKPTVQLILNRYSEILTKIHSKTALN